MLDRVPQGLGRRRGSLPQSRSSLEQRSSAFHVSSGMSRICRLRAPSGPDDDDAQVQWPGVPRSAIGVAQRDNWQPARLAGDISLGVLIADRGTTVLLRVLRGELGTRGLSRLRLLSEDVTRVTNPDRCHAHAEPTSRRSAYARSVSLVRQEGDASAHQSVHLHRVVKILHRAMAWTFSRHREHGGRWCY